MKIITISKSYEFDHDISDDDVINSAMEIFSQDKHFDDDDIKIKYIDQDDTMVNNLK